MSFGVQSKLLVLKNFTFRLDQNRILSRKAAQCKLFYIRNEMVVIYFFFYLGFLSLNIHES